MSEEKNPFDYLELSENSTLASNSLESSTKKQLKIYYLHLKCLMWKQFLVFRRNLKSTLFQLFTPLFICLFLLMLQQVAQISLKSMVNKHPSTESIQRIPKCWGSGCITLGVGFTSGKTDWTDYVLSHLATNQNLKLDSDIKVVAEKDPMDLINYLIDHPNKTQTAVIFCTGPFVLPDNPVYNGTIDCSGGKSELTVNLYSILTNNSLAGLSYLSPPNEPAPIDYSSLAVKVAIDNALISYHNARKSLPVSEVDVSVQRYPTAANRYIEGYNVVTSAGAFYFFIPPMVTFVVVLIEVVREKEYGLRNGLAVIGLSSTTYWHSWFLTGVAFSLIVSTSLIISGLICQFELFLNTPFFMMTLLFLTFSMSMVMLGFLMSTILKRTKSAYTASYAFILVGLVFQFFFSNVSILYLFYSPKVPWWVDLVRVILTLYPPFNFSKAFGDIASVASEHYSGYQKRWVSGNEYTWSRFFSKIHVRSTHPHFNAPSTAESLAYLVMDAVLIGLLGWYLDHVLPSNRGSGKPFYFPFTKSYWKRKKEPAQTPETQVVEASDKSEFGVDLENLNKVYRKYSFMKSKQDLHAVKNLSLEIEKKELFTLLGHNGAGKSTLINMLTGLLSPTSGSAKVCGYDLVEEMDFIRKHLGVCPQHDILWDELTAKEHIILFGRIKGMTKEEIESVVEEKLSEVNLTEVGDNKAGTYSGGMKRRLSVALSGIGNPKIIILDEPTTGMDPQNKRDVWKLIKKLKQNRVMILTTHSMEEADVLSDRISVIVDGELKCLGTSLYLKNNFGEGYRVTLITKNVERVLEIIKEIIPSGKVLDISGGSIVVSMKLDEIYEITRFFRVMEGKEKSELVELIEDWGLSHTTLEEVFMKVTGKINNLRTNSV